MITIISCSNKTINTLLEDIMVETFKATYFSRQGRGRRLGRGRGSGKGKRGFGKEGRQRCTCPASAGTVAGANINQEYIIKAIETNNQEIKDFLFTLGCYEGETITVISVIANQYIVVVKDARYSIDRRLASCIKVC